MRVHRAFATVLAVLAVLQAHASEAQTYPTRVIRLVVPFSAGGQPDTMARLVAQHLSARIGPVVVENRFGAGGTLGARTVASAEPDGHTLLLGTTGALAISPALFRNAGYHPVASFAPVTLVSSAPFILVAAKTTSIRSAGALIDFAKAHPGRLNFGAANATPPHLACERFRRLAGIDMVFVSYKGMAQALGDIVGGQVEVLCEATTVLLPLIEAGHVVPLLVMNPTRLPELPDVPTAAEAGLPDLLVSVWAGLLAPAGTPAAIVDRLNTALVEALRSPEMRESLVKLGATPNSGSPREFATFLESEVSRWGGVVRAMELKAE